MIHGRDLILSINGTPIAASTTCDLSIDTDFIEVCSPTGGAWKEYLPTQHGWDVSAGCLMASMEHFDQLLTMQKNKQRLELSFYDQGLQVFYKGDAYIKKLSTTGTLGNLAKMSVAFQACGELKAEPTHDIPLQYEKGGVHMAWAVGGRWYAYIQNGGSVFYNSIDATTRIRITLNNGAMLLRMTEAELDTILASPNATKLINDRMIACAVQGQRHSVVTQGQFVIIATEGATAFWLGPND